MRNGQRRRRQQETNTVKKAPNTTSSVIIQEKKPTAIIKEKKSDFHDGYWAEISTMCVDQENMRLQVQLLSIAKKNLEATSIDNPSKVHAALETVHKLASRIQMLNG